MNTCYNSATTLKTMIAQEAERIRRWEREMKNLPEGELYCLCRPKRTYFYISCEGKRSGISKNQELIYALARKKYLRILIANHRELLERFDCSGSKHGTGKTKKNSLVSRGETSLTKQLEFFADVGLDVARITCTRKQYDWMKDRYDQNPINPELRAYKTNSGVAVRSKSEQSIGNALEKRGVPYRYEPMITLDVSWMEDVSARFKEYYPDFVIMTAVGSKIIWEHLGRVDRLDYRVHNMEKISAYRQGLGLGERQLIITFEKDLYSQEIIEEIIEDRIMPYV